MQMKPNLLYDELLEIAKSLGYKIRKETGNFKSGNCIIKQENLIILNKFGSLSSFNKTIATAIKSKGDTDIFIKPQIREFIDGVSEDPNLFTITEETIQK